MSDQSKSPEQANHAIAPCAQIPVNLLTAGRFIKQRQAHDYLKAYFDVPGTPPLSDPTHIFGHTFGLNNLRKLMENIDKFNELEDEKIAGVRIYYAMSQRSDPDFPLNPPDGIFKDLIIMPVLESGYDIYPIIGFNEPELILSESRPCPNECSVQSFYARP